MCNSDQPNVPLQAQSEMEGSTTNEVMGLNDEFELSDQDLEAIAAGKQQPGNPSNRRWWPFSGLGLTSGLGRVRRISFPRISMPRISMPRMGR